MLTGKQEFQGRPNQKSTTCCQASQFSFITDQQLCYPRLLQGHLRRVEFNPRTFNFNFFLKRIKFLFFFGQGVTPPCPRFLFQFLILVIFFLGAISLGRVLVLSPKIVINLSGTYEKLPSKGEPDWFSGQQDPLLQTNRQTNIRLLYYKDYID